MNLLVAQVVARDLCPVGEAEDRVQGVRERVKLARKAGMMLHECDTIVADMLGLDGWGLTEELLR